MPEENVMQSSSITGHGIHREQDCWRDEESGGCCLPGEFTRLRYAFGLRLGAVELSDEQAYLVGKHRFHNVRSHGAGVLCGLRVDRFVWPQGAADCTPSTMLRVWRGAALDDCGREVLVSCDQCIDVAVWFANIRDKLRLEDEPECLKLWVGLRYRECPSDPAPVPRDPCGCDNGGCAYTRVREGFELCLFAGEPPPCHEGVFPSAHSLLAALSRDGMPAAERRGEELLERLERLVADPCPEPVRDSWLCLGSFEAVLDCRSKGGPKVVDMREPEDHARCRKMLLSTAALQAILLDLADVASAAGLFGIGPTICGLRFESQGECEGTLRIDVRLVHGHHGEEPSHLAPWTFEPGFVRVHRFERDEARWHDVTPRTAHHIHCGHDHISVRWGPDDRHHRLRPGHYRVSLISPEPTPIVDHHMRSIRPARFGRNFALAFRDDQLILTDVRL
jgi:hypothetical protein